VLQVSFSLQTGEQLSPTGVGYPVAIFNGHQFRVTRFGNTNDYQQAESVTQADIAVHAIRPTVDIALLAQVPLLPAPVLLNLNVLATGLEEYCIQRFAARSLDSCSRTRSGLPDRY
tara:strand:- start:377 stop:724 length:348 start_codon:yes stop_codon:yes gene_type:complete